MPGVNQFGCKIQIYTVNHARGPCQCMLIIIPSPTPSSVAKFIRLIHPQFLDHTIHLIKEQTSHYLKSGMMCWL
jgi:hypothetical protein